MRVEIITLSWPLLTTAVTLKPWRTKIRPTGRGFYHGLIESVKTFPAASPDRPHLDTATALINTLLSAGWTEMDIYREPLHSAVLDRLDLHPPGHVLDLGDFTGRRCQVCSHRAIRATDI